MSWYIVEGFLRDSRQSEVRIPYTSEMDKLSSDELQKLVIAEIIRLGGSNRFSRPYAADTELPHEQYMAKMKLKIKTEALKLAISYHGHDPLGGSPKSEYVLTTAHDFEMYLKGHTYNDPHDQPKTNITNHGSV